PPPPRLVPVPRAGASQPPILLLDEPAAGLDEDESAELAHLARGLAQRWGIGILLVEHDMRFVMSLCDEITVLNFGNLLASGTPEQIRANREVRTAYLGEALEDVHGPEGGAPAVRETVETTGTKS